MNETQRPKILSNIYLFSYIILVLSSMIGMLNINNEKLIFKYGMLLGFTINLFILICYRNRYRFFKIALISSLILLFIVGKELNLNFISLRLITMLIALFNVSLLNRSRLINWDLIIKVLFFIIVISLNVVNIIPDSSDPKGISLGFSSANGTGSIIFGIVLSLLLFVSNKSFNHKISNGSFIYSLIIILVIILIFAHITACKGLFIAGFLDIALIFIYKHYSLNNFIYGFMLIFEILLFILSILVVYKFNPFNRLWMFINNLFSKRIYMQYLIIHEEPLKLFGQPILISIINSINITNLGMPTLTIDNSYIIMAYHYGFVGLVLVDSVFFGISYIISKHKKYIPFVLVISLALYAFIENTFLIPYSLIPILYAMDYNNDRNYTKLW